MMQYDRNMSMEDLFAYWAEGVVLYKHDDGKWWFGTLRHPEKAPIELALWDPINLEEDPPPVVSMDKKTFFDTVVLHRPAINLSMHNGVLYRIAWAPPSRNANKAIAEGQISYVRLAPQAVIAEEFTKSLLRTQARLMNRDYAGGSARAPSIDSSQANVTGLLLLLAALNYRHFTPVEGLLRAIKSKGTPVLVDNDSWIVVTGESLGHTYLPLFDLAYYVGAVLVCTIAYDSYTGHARIEHWASEATKLWADCVYKYIHLINYGEGHEESSTT